VAAEFAIVEGGGSFIRVQSLQLYLLPPFVKISRYQNQSLKLSSYLDEYLIDCYR